MKPGDKVYWWAPLSKSCSIPIPGIIQSINDEAATAEVTTRTVVRGHLTPLQKTVGLNQLTERVQHFPDTDES